MNNLLQLLCNIALERVFAKSHEAALGETAHLEIENPLAHLEKPVSHVATVPSHQTPSLQPVEIPVDPLVGRAIHRCPKQLHDFGKSVNVTFKVELEHIVVTPSEGSVPDWQSKCKEFLSEMFSKCEMHVPKEIEKEMRKKFGTYKHEHAFISDLRSETNESACYILAGEVEVLNALQHHKDSIESSVEETLELSAEEYDFIKELKFKRITYNYPSVHCVLRTTPKFKASLKGPLLHVEKAKKELAQIIQDLKVISVVTDQKIVDHFATTEGKKLLKEYIKTKACPVVPSFHYKSVAPIQVASQTVDTVLSLVLICESAHSGWANSVANDLKQEFRCSEVQVPENLLLIDKMKEYQDLILQLKKDHQIRIVYIEFEKKIFVYGFGESVTATVTNLEAFLQKRKSLSTPLSLPVSQLLGKAFQKRSHGLDQILTTCNQNLSYSFSDDKTEILIESKVFIKGDWKQQLQASLMRYIGTFSVVEIAFNHDALQNILEYLADKEQSQQTPFAFDLQVDLIEIAGENSVIETVKRRVEELSSSCAILTRKVRVQPALHAYLTQVQLETIKKNHPDLTIFLDTSALTIQGPRAELSELDELQSAYLKFTTVSATTDPLLAEFLCEEYGQEFLKSFLDSRQLSSSIAIFQTVSNVPHLDFLCDDASEEAVRTVVRDLQSVITIGKVSLPELLRQPNIQAPVKARLIEFYKKLVTLHNVICSLGSEKIEFGGKVDDVEKAVEKMKTFVKEECTTVKHVQLSKLQWTLIQKGECWIREIQQWLHKVEPLENVSQIIQLRVHLKGEDSKVTAAHKRLLQLRDSLITDSIKVVALGACKFFQSEYAKTTILPGIENHYSVCIETVQFENAEPDKIKSTSISQVCSANEFCCVSTKFEKTGNFVTFEVYIGDLTEFEADVIVNPANCKLMHSGGLAAAIVKKGGQEIQKDCSQHIQSKVYDLDEGDVFFSNVVGKLPCKAIVHAVGPRWQVKSTDHDYEKSRLRNAVTNSLAKAKHYNSIAFPAISSGIFQYPIDQCALAHIEASMNFFKTTKTILKVVSFVVNDQAHARAFHSALSQFFLDKVIPLYLDTCIYDLVPSSTTSKVMLKKTQPKKPKAPKVPSLLQEDLFSTKVSLIHCYSFTM